MSQPKRSLWGLNVAQFLGAFNDNAFKLFLTLLAIRAFVQPEGSPEYEQASQEVATQTFAVMTVPLIVISLIGAWSADRFPKHRIIVSMKAVEVLLMAAVTVALWFEPASTFAPLVVLGCMGAQSALFSPAKYGILPEALHEDQVVAANGNLELWTFAAILGGTIAGGLLLDQFGESTWGVTAVLTSFAVVGFLASLRVPAVEPACTDRGLGETLSCGWRAIRGERALWLGVLGAVFFWGVGSLLTQNALVYGKATLGLDSTQAGIPLAASVIGVGTGCFGVGYLSRGRLELGWIPLGAFGLAIASLGLGVFAPGFAGTLFWMALIGVASGFCIVPLNTLIQLHAPAEARGAVIGVSNSMIFGGILVGTLGCGALGGASWSASSIFIVSAVLTALGTLWAIYLLPAAGLRLVLVLLTNSFYRVRMHGAKNVPAEGGCLLVCNHVSFVDGLFLMATLDRPVRFVVEAEYYNHFFLKPFMKLLGFVPIAQSSGPRELIHSVRAAGQHLDNGEVVCIFAEGEISRTGQMLPFRRGYQRIIKGRDIPVIPVHLDGVWGSVFSFADGRPRPRLPRRIPFPVTVSYGEPKPADVSVAELRRAVRHLECDAWLARERDEKPLHHAFVRLARRAPWRFAVADPRCERVSRASLLGLGVTMARLLRESWRDQQDVGVLLPPSIPAAGLTIAASLSGRTVVHLNYTTGEDGLASACRQAKLKTVVTSRECLEKLDVTLPDDLDVIWLEDLKAKLSKPRIVIAMALGLTIPVSFLERFCGAKRRVEVSDPVTIIFSSGSTGEPKGVVLTHFNLVTNCAATLQVLPVSESDSILGILPFFHSFGTMLFWFSLRHGLPSVFYPNPLDAAAVGKLVNRYGLTVLVATPTFLSLYVRRCSSGQFGSLRVAVVGAEKMPDRVADAFEEKFGIRPLEGYGVTECSPVISVSTPGFRAPGFYQAGFRRSCVGHPLPGIAIRITCPESGVELGIGKPGMIEVRGPSVMPGYLGNPELTRKVLRDGWYVTGDIGVCDEDGYLKITDRLSRFSKIGGEMVPHCNIELALHDALGIAEQVFAVTGIPDARKGERLAVLTTRDLAEVEGLLEKLPELGLPNLFVPRRENFVQVEALPILGTGKLDLRRIKQIALDALAEAGAGKGS